MKSLPAYADFETAAANVLDELHARFGFQLWMITRTEADDWIVLHARDEGYNVSAGDVFRWTDSFCSLMVHGLGPCVALRSGDIPAYAGAPIGRQVPIGAYVGVPMTRSEGDLFGTLCAINPEPICGEVDLTFVELMSRLLMTLFEKEFNAAASTRWTERVKTDETTDTATGLFNRRGWDELLVREERRCERFAHPVCVLAIAPLEGEGGGDGDMGAAPKLKLAARVVNAVVRESDAVARLEQDELLILAADCNQRGAEALVGRLQSALDTARIEVGMGLAMRSPALSLPGATRDALRMMRENVRRLSATPLSSPDGKSLAAVR